MFYYVTVMNENYAQPSLPDGRRRRIVRGMYRFAAHGDERGERVRLLGSGAILREVIAAAELLRRTGTSRAKCGASRASASLRARRARSSAGIACIPRESRAPKPRRDAPCRRHADRRRDRLCARLSAAHRRVCARAVHALGTDGFGRSDTRAALRAFFEVTAITSWSPRSRRSRASRAADAIARYGIEAEGEAPWLR